METEPEVQAGSTQLEVEAKSTDTESAEAAPAVSAAPQKMPSETDAEFAARVAEAAPKTESFKLSVRGEFQSWLERNYRTMSFPAVSELESMLDRNVGNLSADEVKYFADRRK